MTNNQGLNANSTDCLECRLISGFGVIAIGIYVLAQSKKRKSLEEGVLQILSGGTIGLGVTRLFNLPPFKK